MSAANDELFSPNLSVLTIKGPIAVHFMDDKIIEGEYVTQDLFNIFVAIDDDTVMIPRSQIRFIKGKHHQPVEQDTSLADIVGAPTVPAPTPETDRSDTKEHLTASPAAGIDSIPIPAGSAEPEKMFAVADQWEPTFEDDDGTVVIPPDTDQLLGGVRENEDDATFVLPAESDDPVDHTDDSDATFVLPTGTEEYSADDEDGTLVLPFSTADGKGEATNDDDVEDATVVIPQDEPQRLASLVCTAGPHTGQVFKLEVAEVTIGRSSDNNVALSGDKEISRHHASISTDAGRHIIHDLDSLNGTFVNNVIVSEPRPLEDNDMVLVGISTLRYQVD
jgi:hypothetical protein